MPDVLVPPPENNAWAAARVVRAPVLARPVKWGVLHGRGGPRCTPTGQTTGGAKAPILGHLPPEPSCDPEAGAGGAVRLVGPLRHRC